MWLSVRFVTGATRVWCGWVPQVSCYSLSRASILLLHVDSAKGYCHLLSHIDALKECCIQ